MFRNINLYDTTCMEEFGVPFQVGFDKIWNKLEEI
jgi:hypothetical protein